MTDLAKVIRGLECHHNPYGCHLGCPYWDRESVPLKDCDADQLFKDALELLREQEPTTYAYDEYVTPTCQNCGFRPFAGYIPTLKWMEQKGYNYCPGCGRRIKLEVSGDDRSGEGGPGAGDVY